MGLNLFNAISNTPWMVVGSHLSLLGSFKLIVFCTPLKYITKSLTEILTVF